MKLLKLTAVSILLANIFTTSVFAQTRQVPENADGIGLLSSIPIVFENILSVITILAGFAAFIMLIFGGFRYIIAQGDPKAVQAARGTLTWAIVGLVMVIVAWLILAFLADFLNLPLTKFCLGTNCI